jgi:prevent-host-death family protein
MIVNSTDLKNNLGKYLRLSAREEIIITNNGRKVARVVHTLSRSRLNLTKFFYEKLRMRSFSG